MQEVQQEVHEQAERNEDREPLGRTHLVLVAPAPIPVDAVRNLDVPAGDHLPEVLVGLLDKAHFVASLRIEHDVADELAPLTSDHGWSSRDLEVGDGRQRHVGSLAHRHRRAAYDVDVLTPRACVADADRVALAALDAA